MRDFSYQAFGRRCLQIGLFLCILLVIQGINVLMIQEPYSSYSIFHYIYAFLTDVVISVLIMSVMVYYSWITYNMRERDAFHEIGFYLAVGIDIVILFRLVSSVGTTDHGGLGAFIELIENFKYTYVSLLTFLMLSIFIISFHRRMSRPSPRLVAFIVLPIIISHLDLCSFFHGSFPYYSCWNTQTGIRFLLMGAFLVLFCHRICINSMTADIPEPIVGPPSAPKVTEGSAVEAEVVEDVEVLVETKTVPK